MKPLRFECDGAIARLTLDRPDAGNGLDGLRHTLTDS